MNKKVAIVSLIVIILVASQFYFASINKGEKVALVGQGSSFVYPLMSAWICLFSKIRKNISVNYQSTGSGAGIRAILDKTVDFAASDAPMNHEEWSKANSKGTILQFPITIGAVVIAYNLPNLKGRLKLNGSVIADIYLGKITKWDDNAIKELNPHIELPNKDIYVVKRSDGSGTTYVFTDYLSAVSEEWKQRYGKTKIFQFDEKIGNRGIAAKGNEGVGQAILQTPYTIGYIELAYAIETNMKYALLENRDGYFVDANSTTIAAAAENAYGSLPSPSESWENVTMVYQPGSLSYPISSFVYMLVYKEQSDPNKVIALRDWISWILTDGQDFADDLLYVPLPQSVRNIGLSAAKQISLESSTSQIQTIAEGNLLVIMIISTTKFIFSSFIRVF